MAKAFFILTLLYFASFVFADALKIGEFMPDLSGEALAGGNVTLPKAASGKVALVISSFSKKGGQDAQQGARQFSMKFAQDTNVIYYSAIFLEKCATAFSWVCNFRNQKRDA